jgi:phosphate starvation-inducible PhoH-like protein
MGDIVRFHGDVIINDKNGKAIRAITRNQQKLLELLDTNDIVFVNGPAGTGKSHVATWYGIAAIDEKKYSHLVLTRPIIEAGEQLGFLPGTSDDKVSPFMQPLYEAIEKIKGKKPVSVDSHNKQYEPVPISKYKKKQKFDNKPQKEPQITSDDFYSKVSVCPLAYMRGATKERSFIVIDEAQNISSAQLKMAITRIGPGSKMVICGDINQSDLDSRVKSGFREAQNILRGIKGIGFLAFTNDDIVRHRLIRDVLIRYEDHANKNYKNQEGIISNHDKFDRLLDEANEKVDDNVDDDTIESPISKEPIQVKKLPKKGIKKVIIENVISDTERYGVSGDISIDAPIRK